MEITFKGRHTSVPERFRRHATAKLAKLEKLDQKALRIDVEVSQERNPRQSDHSERVELTIRSRGPAIRAEAAADDRYAALDLAFAKLEARLPHLKEIFDPIEEWTKTKTKFEAMDILNKHDIPCGPILSMEELAAEPSLRATGTVVEVDHPKRGKYLSVGNPIKLSDSPTEVRRSPLLGEHTREVLAELGLTDAEISALQAEKVI